MPKKSLFEKLQKRLLQRKDSVLHEVEEKHEEVIEWLDNHKKDVSHLTQGLSKTVATSLATGILLVSAGSVPFKGTGVITASDTIVSDTATKTKLESTEDPFAVLAAQLHDVLPSQRQQLNPEQMKQVEGILHESLGVDAKGTLDGFDLNTNYSSMGGEQHLARFAGDTLAQHAHNASEWAMFGPAGMAPGRGAWGYFPNEDYERYYVVVQTFLAPSWKKNPKAAYDWFKFRKVLVVNPKTGQSLIGVLGDAGPAEWTGKQSGGSPEVMHYLGIAGGPRKGDVLIFFLDETNHTYQLGPLTQKVAE